MPPYVEQGDHPHGSLSLARSGLPPCYQSSTHPARSLELKQVAGRIGRNHPEELAALTPL